MPSSATPPSQEVIVSIDPRTRGGRLSRTCLTALTHETLILPGPLPAGTAVAVLTPGGAALAHTVTEADSPVISVTLDTETRTAFNYLDAEPVGAALPAFLVVGDTTNMVATIPCRIVRNWLNGIAPPAKDAPTYPTTEALRQLLAEMDAAAAAAAESAADADKSRGAAQTALSSATDAAAAANGSARAAENAASEARFARTGAGNSATQASRSAQRANEALNGAMLSESNASDSERAALAAASRSATEADRSSSAASRALESEGQARTIAGEVSSTAAEFDNQATIALLDIAEAHGRALAEINQTGTSVSQEVARAADSAIAEIEPLARRAEQAVIDTQALSTEILKALDPAIYEPETVRALTAALAEESGLPAPAGYDAPVPQLASLPEATQAAKATNFTMHGLSAGLQAATSSGASAITENLKEI